jgi:NADPH:quinone reductase-like Zn-dependent oxidoreductase
MNAVQIPRYSKQIHTVLRDIPMPAPGETDVLVQIKAAAVNPVELLIATGRIRLIQHYSMPLTLGNECAGIVVKVGASVTQFQAGDHVYARLPVESLGAFAEYVSIPQQALAKMPVGYDFTTAAAIPLTGLTAWQCLTEALEAKPGETILIPGGSGSFGEMAVPIAKSLGLQVIVSGNARSKTHFLHLGADRYLDYRAENYWEVLPPVDHVIDTLGADAFAHELSVLKPGGRLVSLRTGPNRSFAVQAQFPAWKTSLFSLAGARYDRAARRQGKTYRFLFVRADGTQLQTITEIVERCHIMPRIDPHLFSLSTVGEALSLVREGHPDGKVILQIS